MVPDVMVRCVVTTHVDGRPSLLSDGQPDATRSLPGGGVMTEVLRLDHLRSLVFRMPPGDGQWLRVPDDDPVRPGMHTSDTLDLVQILDGTMTLGLEDQDLELRPNDAVVVRGTPHRWRIGPDGCTYTATVLRPDPANPTVAGSFTTSPAGAGVRRVVTGGPALLGEPPIKDHGLATVAELWHTFGPLASAHQGGDVTAPGDPQPGPGGISWRWVEVLPRPMDDDEGWHSTPTVDVVVVLAGRVALELPGDQRAELGAGDVVVQHGTEHRWVVRGEAPYRMAALMVGVDE